MFKKLFQNKLQKKRRRRLEETFYDKNKARRLGEVLQQYQPSVKYKLKFKEEENYW
ncbi:hypothetical protein [Limosilactobacillus reuteri]|uniref:hypothetical protein n=1 Tax=Limosilactobacillus reuteri TaxID=1598 RepID=UPI001E5CD1A4|nr:hypothetical protein [Limosilactobacillus reuteri]MCC4487009.1 hypothetical protein [Limosilactobacillus reuteri]UFK69199.1 hypothetical protein IVR12_02310 [Limosilactobacillus reuteri]